VGNLVVVKTHLERTENLEELLAMLDDANKTTITYAISQKDTAPTLEEDNPLIIPVSDIELMQKITESLSINGQEPSQIEKIMLDGFDSIYMGHFKNNQKTFARVVSRRTPCVDCHDASFIYSFDATGKFLAFVPIDIRKIYNEKWNEEDVNKLESRLVGERLLSKIHYNPKVDAISSATISSTVVYDSINKSPDILNALESNGYL
jgi:hypothetical protein